MLWDVKHPTNKHTCLRVHEDETYIDERLLGCVSSLLLEIQSVNEVQVPVVHETIISSRLHK